MKRFWTLTVTVLAVAALAVPASAAAPLVVDDDGVECGNAGFTTIQAAVDAALPGDTIKVCAGTYAGAAINKTVKLQAKGDALINAGPFYSAAVSLPRKMRAGFRLDAGAGGTEITGFRFQGVQQFGSADDFKLDFGIFSRTNSNVTVAHNTFASFCQAITNWNGSGWSIEHNQITDLWSLNGGAIGIFVGGTLGGTYQGNVIAHNAINGTLHVYPSDGGGYDGSGIALYADFRYGQAGAAAITGNRVEHNKISMTSDKPLVVDFNGIELTDTRGTLPVVTGNEVSHNDLADISGIGIYLSDAPGNLLQHNKAEDNGGFDFFDDSVGSGTAGTANDWIKDRCESSSPNGLCK